MTTLTDKVEKIKQQNREGTNRRSKRCSRVMNYLKRQALREGGWMANTVDLAGFDDYMDYLESIEPK